MNVSVIDERLRRNSIPFHPDLPEKIGIYLEMLTEWNRHMDLTADAEEDEMLDRHFMDSLAVLRTGLLPDSGTLVDVGTGAGFPGLVLALACPGLRVTLMDAQSKRLRFLEAVIQETGTGNASVLHARAEDAARDPLLRESFDIAAARALAPLNVLSEYLLPFVRVDGLALCWKGPSLTEELDAGRRAVHLLGGRLEMPVRCSVDGREWDHRILPVRKIQKTASAYPRKAGIPKAKPLGEHG